MGQSRPFDKADQKDHKKDHMSQAKKSASAKIGRCPICKADTEPKFRPFCSSRCCDIDLGNWLTGGYVIAVDDSGSSEDDGSDAQASRTPVSAQRKPRDDDET
jgi:uncharacterized protein